LRGNKKEEKPKIQVREAADRAMTEIKTVPPQLMMYSILGAVVLILIVAVGVYMHVRSEDDDSTSAPRPTRKAAAQAEQAAAAPAPVPVQIAPPAVDEQEPEVTIRQVEKRAAAPRKKAAAPTPIVVPGSMQIDSTPAGAQIQLDGRSDPGWVTPF